MHRSLFIAVFLPFVLAQAQTPDEPKVNVKAPEFRGTEPRPKHEARTLRDAVDAMSPADLQAIVELLRQNYLAPDKLDDDAIARATAQGLLERFSPGIMLPLGQDAAPETDSPFRSETLDQRAGYIRLGSLTEKSLAEIDTALKGFSERGLPAVILDLRATPRAVHFELAAQLTERFCPKGRMLFTIRRPSTREEKILTSKLDPSFKGVLVTLVDADTAGAAEVVAAVLRTQAKALVIGEQTRGEAVEYADVALPSGRKLRVAVAEVALPENVMVFPGGVKPDIAVEIAPGDTERVLDAALEGGLAPLIIETERPRMNEAALVAGTNPELEAMRMNRGKKTEVPLRDVALQRALDAITTITLFESKPAPASSR